MGVEVERIQENSKLCDEICESKLPLAPLPFSQKKRKLTTTRKYRCRLSPKALPKKLIRVISTVPLKADTEARSERQRKGSKTVIIEIRYWQS